MGITSPAFHLYSPSASDTQCARAVSPLGPNPVGGLHHVGVIGPWADASDAHNTSLPPALPATSDNVYGVNLVLTAVLLAAHPRFSLPPAVLARSQRARAVFLFLPGATCLQ
jgi:hypothetical protein